VGNDALLPNQNTISRVGKFESRGGGGIFKKKLLAHPVQKSCRCTCTNPNGGFT